MLAGRRGGRRVPAWHRRRRPDAACARRRLAQDSLSPISAPPTPVGSSTTASSQASVSTACPRMPSGRKAGMPMMISAPRSGPASSPRPPTTTSATTSMLALAGKLLTVSEVWPWPMTTPPRPARAPATAYAWSLRTGAATVKARAASSLSRSATSTRPKPLRRRLRRQPQPQRQHQQREAGSSPWRGPGCSRSSSASRLGWPEPSIQSCRSSQALVASAKASVVTASARPRSRSAGMPTMRRGERRRGAAGDDPHEEVAARLAHAAPRRSRRCRRRRTGPATAHRRRR